MFSYLRWLWRQPNGVERTIQLQVGFLALIAGIVLLVVGGIHIDKVALLCGVIALLLGAGVSIYNFYNFPSMPPPPPRTEPEQV